MSKSSLKDCLNDLNKDQQTILNKNKIQQLNKRLQQLNTKNTDLLQQVHTQTTLVLKYSKNYQQEKQKSTQLQKILQQVQIQADNAKFYWAKAFKQQVQKIKHLQRLNQQLKQENIKLSSEISCQSQNKYQNSSSKVIHDKNQQLFILQQRLKTLQLKQKRWTEKALQFKHQIKQKQTKNKKLLQQIKTLQQQLSLANKKITQLQQIIINPQSKSNISNQSTQIANNSNKWHSQQQQHQQVNTQRPLQNPIQYVKMLQQKANLPQNQIYYRQGDYYILNHSNIQIDMQMFLLYDWSLLKQLNLYKTSMDDKKWKLMVWQSFKFPNLEVIYLFGNSIKIVKQQQVRMFDKLCQVVLHYTDQIKGMKAFSKLQNKQQKPKVVIKQKPIIVVKQKPVIVIKQKPKIQQQRITYQ